MNYSFVSGKGKEFAYLATSTNIESSLANRCDMGFECQGVIKPQTTSGHQCWAGGRLVGAGGRLVGGWWEAGGRLVGGWWEAGGRLVAGRWEAGGGLVGGWWEAGGRLVAGRWEAGGGLVGGCWEAGGRLVEGWWQAGGRLEDVRRIQEMRVQEMETVYRCGLYGLPSYSHLNQTLYDDKKSFCTTKSSYVSTKLNPLCISCKHATKEPVITMLAPPCQS